MGRKSREGGHGLEEDLIFVAPPQTTVTFGNENGFETAHGLGHKGRRTSWSYICEQVGADTLQRRVHIYGHAPGLNLRNVSLVPDVLFSLVRFVLDLLASASFQTDKSCANDVFA
jgi:hypothetical protein